jgi:general secretion pathway protein G
MGNKSKILAVVAVLALLIVALLRYLFPTIKEPPAPLKPAPAPPPKVVAMAPITPVASAIQAPVLPPTAALAPKAAATPARAAPDPVAQQEKIAAVKTFVTDTVKLPFMNYRMNTGHYPVTADGLTVLIENTYTDPNWRGPYMDVSKDGGLSLLQDPWGNDYQYEAPGTHNPNSYDLWSNGPDGISGTADDIGNW